MNVILFIGLALLLNIHGSFAVTEATTMSAEMIAKIQTCTAIRDYDKISVILSECQDFPTLKGVETGRHFLDLSTLRSPYFIQTKTSIKVSIRICDNKNNEFNTFNGHNWITETGEAVKLELCNNKHLKEVHLLKATEIASLKVNNNDQVHTLMLPEAIHIDLMEVTKNPQIPSLILTRAKTIKKTFVEDNKGLTTVAAPLVTMIEGLKIKNNPFLAKVTLGVSLETELRDTNEISNNPALKTIQLDDVKTAPENMKEFAILDNPSLESIVMTSTGKISKIRVRGNYKLTKQSIDELKAICDATCDIQEFQECSFTAPVSDLRQLNICKNVYGNLELDPTVSGKTTVKIEKIDGNLKIVNSNLTIEELQFLDATKITGSVVFTGNVQICDGDAAMSELFKNAVGTKTIATEACPTTTVTTTEAPTTAETTTAEATTTTTGMGGASDSRGDAKKSRKAAGTTMFVDRKTNTFAVFCFGGLMMTGFVVLLPFYIFNDYCKK